MIDKKAGSVFDRVDDGFVHRQWNCRATPTSAEETQTVDTGLVDIRSAVHYY